MLLSCGIAKGEPISVFCECKLKDSNGVIARIYSNGNGKNLQEAALNAKKDCYEQKTSSDETWLDTGRCFIEEQTPEHLLIQKGSSS